jgi:hypothetical protein
MFLLAQIFPGEIRFRQQTFGHLAVSGKLGKYVILACIYDYVVAVTRPSMTLL